jgi:hypothetical protein
MSVNNDVSHPDILRGGNRQAQRDAGKLAGKEASP